MKQSKKVVALLMAAAMVMGAFAGCSSKEESKPADNNTPAETTKPAEDNKTEAPAGGVTADHDFTVAVSSDLKTLDPHATNDSASSLIYLHLYNTLTKLDQEGKIAPDLAASWEKVSDTEIKFKLNEGVKFHNGEELKATDVKFSLEREKEGARTAYLLEKVQEVRVDGDYEFTLLLSEPDGSLLYNLSQGGSSILNEKAVTEAGENYAQSPVGTGPLKYTEWVPNDHITLSRFDEYFDQSQPISQSVTFRVIPEATSRTIALENGEVDAVGGIAPVDVTRVEENQELEHVFVTNTGVEYVGFNFERQPFDNILVRQAICHAINKEEVIQVALEGRGEVSNTVVGIPIPGRDETVEGYAYDPEKAKELLKEAGFENGFDTTLKTSGDVRSLEAQVVQANLAAVGINVEIELLDWGAYLEAINGGDMDMYIISWGNPTMDPAESLNPLFNSKNWGPTGNRMHYANPEVDDLLNELMRVDDEARRLELSSQIQHKVVADAPWATMFCKQTCLAYRKGIQGLVVMPNDVHNYAHMQFPVA